MSVSGAISFLRLSLFPVEVGKLFPCTCMIIFNLLFQDLLRQESWYSPIIFVVRFVFLKPPDCYSGFAVNWIFFMLSVITVPSSRQRHSDNEVCSLYFILTTIFSVGTLPFRIGVFVDDLFQLEDSPDLCRSPFRLGPFLV